MRGLKLKMPKVKSGIHRSLKIGKVKKAGVGKAKKY